MTGLFLTKPMSMWTPYGLLVLGFLAVLMIVLGLLACDAWRRYRYSQDKAFKAEAIYLALAELICLCFALFIILRRGWVMGLAFTIVIGVAFRTVGGGIRSQAERE